MIEVPIIAEGALTAELVARFGPVTDFFAVGEEIWGTDDPLAALKALLAPLGLTARRDCHSSLRLATRRRSRTRSTASGRCGETVAGQSDVDMRQVGSLGNTMLPVPAGFHEAKLCKHTGRPHVAIEVARGQRLIA